jgi:tetratricopeptide (TPR) repeat protein
LHRAISEETISHSSTTRGAGSGGKGTKRISRLADYNKAIGINPKHASAYLNRCSALKSKKDYAAAIRDCTTALEINPELAAAYNNRGTVYADQEDYDRAIQDYTAAIRLNGKYALAYTNRGAAYRMKGDKANAKEDYLKAQSLSPDEDTKQRIEAGLVAIGVSAADKDADPDYQGCNKLYGNAAIAACDRAIASNKFAGPDLAVLYSSRAYELVDQNRMDDAMSDADAAISLDPESESAFNQRGDVYYTKGEYEPAIKDYSEGIRLAAKAYSLTDRGNAYRELKDYDRAIADYSETIRLDSTYTRAFWNRGKAYHTKGDDARAREDYTTALSLNPTEEMKQDIEDALKELPAPTASTPSDSTAISGSETPAGASR